MYTLSQFASMFADHIRTDAYVAAIEQSVKPGHVVVDLGSGPGVLSLLACKAGASRVYAIDVNGIVEFGRTLAAANGCAERIHFLRGDSRQIQLPERADVIVSDLRGVLPLFAHAVDSIHDARDRFLAEGGRLIPQSDTLLCALVEHHALYEEIAGAWRAIPSLDLSSGLPLVLNSLYSRKLKPEHLVSKSAAWGALHYTAGVKSVRHQTVQLTALRDCVGHGLGLWFETQLRDGIGYSSAPGDGATVYGHVFIPWLEPVTLTAGETCCIDLRADWVGKDYVWQWHSQIPAFASRPAIHFRQSTFHSSVFSPYFLKTHAADFVPVLSKRGIAERWLLQAIDGRRSLEDIAAEAARIFPDVFCSVESAFSSAADIAEKFSR